jgi:hypothetical protein
MDAAALLKEVEAEMATELARLGSSKLLIALTGATLEPDAVLRAAADSEAAARDTFAAWAADETAPEARAAFEAVAEQERDHLGRVTAELDSYDPPDAPGVMHASLRDRDGTVERIAAGMIGRVLVSHRTHGQLISFFVNEADERRADLFRGLRDETTAVLDDGRELLDLYCGDDGDWSDARTAAVYTVRTAHDAYADALSEMGVDPKPAC